MEASALQAPAALARSRRSIGSPLLRVRSDEQLVALFRSGNEEAFGIIHDRYRQRLFAYTRQMLPGSRQDAEDALQDVFVRAYTGLRSSNRQLALRAWLYRVAHNRCVDELRRPPPPSPELMQIVRPPVNDPIAEAERRDSLRRLIEDVRRLPEQQRSALLMRELGGIPYADMADALGVSVPAVKSLLVRARIGLAHSKEARDTACCEIRRELVDAHDRGVRPNGMTRRHMRDCQGCLEFRAQMRGTSRQLAALVPLGPLGVLCSLFGFGSHAAGGGAAGSGAAAGGVAGTGGAVASIGAVAGGAATHVATIIAAAVVTAGGAVEIQRSVASAPRKASHQVTISAVSGPAASATAGSSRPGPTAAPAPAASSAPNTPPMPARVTTTRASATLATAGPAIPAVDQLNPTAIGDSSSGAAGASSYAGASAGTPPAGGWPATPGTAQPSAAGPAGGTDGTVTAVGDGSGGNASTGMTSAGTPNDGSAAVTGMSASTGTDEATVGARPPGSSSSAAGGAQDPGGQSAHLAAPASAGPSPGIGAATPGARRSPRAGSPEFGQQRPLHARG